jgi:hypothetical protein
VPSVEAVLVVKGGGCKAGGEHGTAEGNTIRACASSVVCRNRPRPPAFGRGPAPGLRTESSSPVRSITAGPPAVPGDAVPTNALTELRDDVSVEDGIEYTNGGAEGDKNETSGGSTTMVDEPSECAVSGEAADPRR